MLACGSRMIISASISTRPSSLCVCFCVLPWLKTSFVKCDLDHGTKCYHLGLTRGLNVVKYIYFALWHMTVTQLVFNKYLFETVILFSKAFQCWGCLHICKTNLCPHSKSVVTPGRAAGSSSVQTSILQVLRGSPLP